MAIWDEKQISKYGKKETDRPFHYFQMYLDQTPPRSVRELHDDLKSGKKSGRKSGKVLQLKTLYGYCTEFNWVERAKAYDQYKITSRRENKELQLSGVYSDVAEFSTKEIHDSIDFVKFSKKVISDALKLYNAGEISLEKFNKYVESTTKTYKSAVELVHGYDPTPVMKEGHTFNNINQVGKENHMTFQDLFDKKGDVIDEVLDDEDGETE